MIVETTKDGKKVWCVKSHQTGRNFGCYPSRKEAQKRLVQIKIFGDSKGWR